MDNIIPAKKDITAKPREPKVLISENLKFSLLDNSRAIESPTDPTG